MHRFRNPHSKRRSYAARKHRRPWCPACLALVTFLGACSDNDTPAPIDSGAIDDSDGGLRVFTPPPSRPPGGSILVTASGEVLALTGYAFPPASEDDPAFVDGWEVRFDHLLATIGDIRISESPDKSPGNQGILDKIVARVEGPFAVDLATDSPTNIDGEGDPGSRAVPLAVIEKQNQSGNASFATDGTRYGFSYDLVPASARAYDVNLDPEGRAAYQTMVAEGCTVLYVGTATFKGVGCRTYGSLLDAGDPFARIPTSVRFQFCFKSPTSYLNCQNGANDPADPLPGEAHQRGIAPRAGAFVVGQITIHTDHPFWESTTHDSPAHFDPFAARAVGQSEAMPLVTLDDVVGVDFLGFTDALGNPLGWRSCLPADQYTPPKAGQMAFDPRGVPIGTPASDQRQALRDFYDFATYNQSTEGHLNIEDGLCFVQRNYPSPR